MNKLSTKYSSLEFKPKKFKLLKGEIISQIPLWKFTLIYTVR